MGFDIQVDENGDSEGNYTVLGFANASDEHLSPVGRFSIAPTDAGSSNGTNGGELLPVSRFLDAFLHRFVLGDRRHS